MIPRLAGTSGRMVAARSASAAVLLLLCILPHCVLAQEDDNITVIVLDISSKHAEKVASDLEPFLESSDVIARMSVRQTGGPAATRRRIERMMRYHGAALALPYAIFSPRNETERQEGIEKARTMDGGIDRLLCEIVPRDPELQSRVFMSAGNYHTLNFFIELCDLAFGVSVDRINLVGSCVIDVNHRRYMRTESGTEEFHSVRDSSRPRPDVLLCVRSVKSDALDTSVAAVLSAARFTRSKTAMIECTKLWSGGRPAMAVPEMMHPMCQGGNDAAQITVIDV